MGTRRRNHQNLPLYRILPVVIPLLCTSLSAHGGPAQNTSGDEVAGSKVLPNVLGQASADSQPLRQDNATDPGTSKKGDDSSETKSAKPESKRILGILPNYRSSPSLRNYEPLTPKEKFKIASEDGFDRGTIALAAMFGGLGQLTKASPSFGQGVPG
jgi:hypothetical protein